MNMFRTLDGAPGSQVDNREKAASLMRPLSSQDIRFLQLKTLVLHAIHG